jgi:hypothetical protein
MIKRFIIIAIISICCPSSILAQEQLNTLVADVLGCSAKYDDQGNIKSIKCQGEAEMAFTDSKGQRIAQQQAVISCSLRTNASTVSNDDCP